MKGGGCLLPAATDERSNCTMPLRTKSTRCGCLVAAPVSLAVPLSIYLQELPFDVTVLDTLIVPDEPLEIQVCVATPGTITVDTPVF